jgi:hypothetical protein
MPIRFSGPIRSRVILSLRTIAKVDSTARRTKANDTALDVWLLI